MRAKKSRWKILVLSEVVLIGTCLSMFLLDKIFGNGDGYIDRLSINPLLIFLIGQLLIAVVAGLSSSRNWIVNFSLTILSLSVMLIILEGSIRSFSDFHKRGIKVEKGLSPYRSFDRVFFKDYNPNCTYTFKNSKLDGGKEIRISINADRMRGPRIMDKPSGKKRIMLIGDSFIQANQVEFEHTIASVLNSKAPDSLEFIQHGYPSWSPLLEFNWLIKKRDQLPARSCPHFSLYQ